jgi:ureidoglycolate dehydrogenase (NAD+)
MATATVALGRIREARASGVPLPEGAAATADGTPTTDPEKAAMALPLGGAKGSGMSLAFELLTSALVGAPISASFHSDDPAGRKHRQNALLIAVDPAAFGGTDTFTANVDTTLATLKGLPVADGADGVYYPGECSAAVAAARGEHGIPVAPKVWRDLTEQAEKLGVTLPEPIGQVPGRMTRGIVAGFSGRRRAARGDRVRSRGPGDARVAAAVHETPRRP